MCRFGVGKGVHDIYSLKSILQQDAPKQPTAQKKAQPFQFKLRPRAQHNNSHGSPEPLLKPANRKNPACRNLYFGCEFGMNVPGKKHKEPDMDRSAVFTHHKRWDMETSSTFHPSSPPTNTHTHTHPTHTHTHTHHPHTHTHHTHTHTHTPHTHTHTHHPHTHTHHTHTRARAHKRGKREGNPSTEQ